jgi:hypothetical protein
MKNNQLDRLMNLIHKTGDRMVVLDRETDEVVVMMSLDEYENLRDMPNNSGGEDFFVPSSGDDFFSKLSDEEKDKDVKNNENDKIFEDDSMSRVDEPIFAAPARIKAPETKPASFDLADDWSLNNNNAKTSPEESLADVPAEEEEKFYLEPVD